MANQLAWTDRPVINACWVETGESPESIAAKTAELLRQLQTVTALADWSAYRGPWKEWDGPEDLMRYRDTRVRWDGSDEWLTEFVHESIVRDEQTTENPIGDERPDDGYSFTLFGDGPTVGLSVRIYAGSIYVGSVLPAHKMLVELREIADGGLSVEMVDAICGVIVSAWKPATLKMSNGPVRRLAQRGNWKIGVGYRVWINAEIGTVDHVADGLTATELAGGTMISAPESWAAEHVVQAMLVTLEANNLDEVPH